MHNPASHAVRRWSCVSSRPLKAQLHAELAAATNDDDRDQISAAHASREKALEHDLDHK